MDETGTWRVGAPRQEEYARALASWALAEEQAAQAEALLDAHRERARVAWLRAFEQRGRAEHAFAARQVAFARGLLDAAEAHERAAASADGAVADAERRARPLRAHAEARRRAVHRLVLEHAGAGRSAAIARARREAA